VVVVGHTLMTGVVPTTGPVVPAPWYHFIDAIELPDGTKRHASFVADQLGSSPFLPGGTDAKVPVAFWIPTMAFPSFQVPAPKLSIFFLLYILR